MYSSLAQVKEPGKNRRRHIAVVPSRLHLLVATLHGIGSTLGSIVQDICVVKSCISCPLAQREHDAHALTMELSNGSLQQVALHDIAKAGAITQAHPGNTCKGVFVSATMPSVDAGETTGG